MGLEAHAGTIAKYENRQTCQLGCISGSMDGFTIRSLFVNHLGHLVFLPCSGLLWHVPQAGSHLLKAGTWCTVRGASGPNTAWNHGGTGGLPPSCPSSDFRLFWVIVWPIVALLCRQAGGRGLILQKLLQRPWGTPNC
mmetsp:Transcript_11453/g.20656  ORF Transcript_11453/g.20656 Transcript_11453/m.20656 type:complete len:138 (+) Transcript_11453:230-643(+)